MTRILVVDDDPDLLDLYRMALRALPGAEASFEGSSARAASRLESEPFDLLITDLQMPGIDGMELLKRARAADPELPVLMVSGYGTIERAVEAMKLGALDFLTKPFLPDNLLAVVRRLLQERHLVDESRVLRRQMERPYAFDEVVGHAAGMRAVFDLIRKLADTDVDVLITGETGTGKELVARTIHGSSRRSAGPFVPVDSGAIPENLLESELFGHEKGAFTGAEVRRIGLMELATAGTFFLDEIGDMPAALQVKLLRALQERKIRRVGGKAELPVDVRVVAATHCDLEGAIGEGRFRQDLYYRLNVVRIELPSLRERREDIPDLVKYFLDRFAREMGKVPPKMSAELVRQLAECPWPGNVRQLQNTIKRAVAMAHDGELSAADFKSELGAVQVSTPEQPLEEGEYFGIRDRNMDAFEKGYLGRLLMECGGDVTKAGRQSHLPRGTLYRLMKKHGLTGDQFRP